MALENKLGLTSSADLAREEERLSKKKAVELFENGVLDTLPAGKFSTLQAIHKYLFEDIYDFAGKLRTVNLAKGNFRFAPLIYLEAALANIEKLSVPAEDVNGKVIFDHLDDADVSATVNSWIDSIAFGIIGLVHIFNPEMVLIGGGISREDEHFIRPLREKILNGAMEQFAKDLEVEAAALGNNAGLLGACAYFRQNF